MFLPFYLLPCALVALVVNNRWATLFVIICSIIPPIIQYDGDSDYRSHAVFAWNLICRFILVEIIILTLGRIRLEFDKTDPHVK
jgi:hypothetical protein